MDFRNLMADNNTHAVVSCPPDGSEPLVLSGKDIDTAAKDPKAIGQLMVDMALAEGKDLTGCALYFEHNSLPKPMLSQWATGLENLITGGWVRIITSRKQLASERLDLDRAVLHGDATIHGTHRGVLLVQFHAGARQQKPTSQGFGREVA